MVNDLASMDEIIPLESGRLVSDLEFALPSFGPDCLSQICCVEVVGRCSVGAAMTIALSFTIL